MERISVWPGIISGSFSLAAIAISFMLEKLFLEETPWWAWGIMAVVSLAVGLVAAWIQSKRIAKMSKQWEVIAYHGEPLNLADTIGHALTGGLFAPKKRIPSIIRNTMTGEIRNIDSPKK